MSTETTMTGVPLAWRDALGYQCPSCGLYVTIPRSAWATCPRCPGIPVDETATWLLAFAGFDESDRSNAVAALQPLLAALPAPAPAPSGVPEAAVEAARTAARLHSTTEPPPHENLEVCCGECGEAIAYPGCTAEETAERAWRHTYRAALTAALPLLTAAPSATRDEDARFATRPAPAWDEEAVAEAFARAIWAHGAGEAAYLVADLERMWDEGTLPQDPETQHSVRVIRAQAAAVLAAVRNHLPVKPSREGMVETLYENRAGYLDDLADAVLALWPGESRATVQAEALAPIRAALANHPACDIYPDDDPVTCGWKRAVADVQAALDKGENRG